MVRLKSRAKKTVSMTKGPVLELGRISPLLEVWLPTLPATWGRA